MQEFIDFAIRKWYLFAALAAILGLLIGGELFHRLRGIRNVDPNEALRLMNYDDALMLDVRDSGEYRQGHIAEARNLPAASLKERLGELEGFKGRPIVVYCQSGTRSGSACAELRRNGFEKVYNLSGGLTAWQGASLPVKRKKKK